MTRKQYHTANSLEYLGLLGSIGTVGAQISQSDIESIRETHRKNAINARFVSLSKATKR